MPRFISTLSAIMLGLGCFVGIGNAANFSDKSIGISIELDDEFVEQPQRRAYRFFSTPDNSALVLIKPVHELSLYDLRKELKDGSWEDDGISLDVTGDDKTAQVNYGSGVLVPVQGRVGEYKVRGVFGGFSGYDDQNFLVIGVARPDYWSERRQSIEAMFDSIRFIAIDYSEMIANWAYRLSGKSLVPLNPAARGPLVPQPINLCSNGTVASEKPASTQPAPPAPQQRVWNGYAWVTAPVAPMMRPPARWSIEPIRGKPTLLIRVGQRPQEFVLEMEADQLLVNGKPYSITENTLCQ